MPHQEPASVDKLALLLRDVFRLRATMRQNSDDSRLSHDGVKIHYLLDPDILELYVRPDLWTKSVAALPSLRKVSTHTRKTEATDLEMARGPDDVLPSSTVLEATALLTGEYIFSRQLVGSNGHLFIAPEHTAEFLGHIARIESRSRQAAHGAASIGDQLEYLRSRLNHEKQKNAQGLVSADRWLSQSRKLLVEGLAGVSHSELLASHRLERLLEKKVLADAASLPSFTTEIIAPDVNQVTQLSRDIAELKRRNRIPSSKEAVEADAVTLAQLMMLNDGHQDRESVYLLITRDRSLHTTYAEWVRKEARSRARPPLFALRFPRQYVPILNVSDMGGNIKTREIFQTIEQAIYDVTTLFLSTNVAEDDGQWPQFYEHEPDFNRMLLHLRNAASTPTADSLWHLIEGMAEKWSQLTSYAVAAKSDIIEELMEKETTYWNALITNGRLEDVFGSHSRNVAIQFERFATSSTLLRQEIWALNEAANRSGLIDRDRENRWKREIASTFRDFTSTPFAQKTLETIINEGPRGSDGIAVLQAAEIRAERLLISGSICLEIGAWAAAKNLLDRARDAAQQKAPTEPPGATSVLHEIKFFACVARRLAANADNWQREYDAAAEDLIHLGRSNLRSSFETARILSERVGLALCSLSWAVHPDRLARSLEANRHAEQALSLLKTISKEFGASPLFEGGAQPGWIAIVDHLTLNIMVLAFWWWTLRGEVDSRLQEFTDLALARRNQLANVLPTGSAHEQLYPELARLALTEAANTPQLRLTLIDAIDEIMTSDRESSFGFDLPATDKAEFSKIRQILAA